MEKDNRLLPLPQGADLQLARQQDVPANYSPFYDDDSLAETRSLRDYFLIVYKRLPLILALTILITSLVAFYMYRLPSMFEAQATMVIDPPSPTSRAKDGGININFGGDPNYYPTQLRLLRNYDLMKEVVARLGMHKQPNLFNQNNKGLFETLRSAFSGDKESADEKPAPSLPTLTDADIEQNAAGALTPEEQARLENYAGIMLGGLNVEQVQNTNLVNVRVQSVNPEIAARVADMICVVFIERDADKVVKSAKESYEELNKSIDNLKLTISQQDQEKLVQLKDAGLPLTTNSSSLTSDRLKALSAQWLEAENKRRDLQARLDAAINARRSGKGEFIPEIVTNPGYQDKTRFGLESKNKLEDRIRDYDKQIQEAETKKKELLVKYTEEYPEVKRVQTQIESLISFRDKVRKEIDTKVQTEEVKNRTTAIDGAITSLQSQVSAAATQEAQLRAAYFRETGQASQQAVAETRLNTLTNEIETNRGLLKDYMQRQKEMELAITSAKPDNITVSNKAAKPMAPIGPQRNRNITIAFLLSLALGVGLAFLLDYLDDSIKNSDDVARHLGLPTLALIPHQSMLEKKRKTAGAIAARNGNQSTALISLEDNRSAMAEAYRHLRTSLLFSSAGKPPQAILVTSSQPSEGKTTTAINTAITLAQSGAEVVIIDCDLRRPRLHGHFHMENTTGLTNFLSGDRDFKGILKPYDELPKLKVITSGPIPPNPAELLSSQEMKNLIQSLKGQFNHIVIDSPPAISFTDSAILSTLVDGVVIVAMSGKSSIQLIKRFKQRLGNIGARIYGVVLNGIKPDSFEYGYYGYGYQYAYDYYHNPDDDDSTPLMEEEYQTKAAKR